MKSKGRVFLLDDEELIVTVLSKTLKKAGYDVYGATKIEGAIEKIKSWNADVILLDINMPGRNGLDILVDIKSMEGIDLEVVMLTADDNIETAVRAMKMGAADYLTKPFNTDEIKIVIQNIIEKEDLKKEVRFLRKAYAEAFEREFIGQSSVIKSIDEKIQKMAKARVSNILVTGESGTGKELVARHIHKLMHGIDTSKHAPFISVNCPAMPESLLESQLFGHEKGAFTDAKSDRKGLFELANGGTLLLDEIGEMRPDLQSKLLRVLEERKIRRIGAKSEILIDTTVIATTNRNLSEAVKKGDFRKDLFFRLSTFYLHVAPLRERSDDIQLLANHFLARYTAKYKNNTIKGFSPEAGKILSSYKWPGNVRELKNLIERFVVLENTEVLDTEHFPRWIFGESMATDVPLPGKFILPESGIFLEEVEKDLILQALKKAKNNKTRAAKLLNISYDTLRYQVKKFGIQ